MKLLNTLDPPKPKTRQNQKVEIPRVRRRRRKKKRTVAGCEKGKVEIVIPL
jgi:translation initiation factor 1 (eIF-1/SUI1)